MVGVIVAITVSLAIIIIIIIITAFVIGIVLIWKKKKSKQHTCTRQEGLEGEHYITTDEMLPKTLASKPEIPMFCQMDDVQDSNEPQYIEIFSSTNQIDEVSSKHKVETSGNSNPAFLSKHEVKMQDNPSYSCSSQHQVKIQDNPAYFPLNIK